MSFDPNKPTRIMSPLLQGIQHTTYELDPSLRQKDMNNTKSVY